MKKLTFSLIAVFIFILTSSPALALSKNTPRQPHLLIGEQLTLEEKTYSQDTVVISGQSEIDSLIKGDAIIVSGQTNLSSDTNVSEDLLVISGQQSISGQIKQDVIVVGGEIKIEKDTIIDGYLLAIGGQVTLAGTVKGSTHIFAGQTIIKDSVLINGDLEVKTGDIIFSSDAKILGEKKVQVQEGWQNLPNLSGKYLTQEARRQTRNFRQAFSLYSFLTHLLALFVLIYFFAKKIDTLLKQALKSTSNTFGRGLIYLLLTPLLAIFLIPAIITLPLVGFTFFIYSTSIYLSSIFTAIALGQYLQKQKLLPSKNPYLYGFLGLLILNLLFHIPFLKPLSKFISLLFGLGVFSLYLQQVFKRKK